MKNRIMNKLRSNKGASITFALLLFLVCAVLCSVILAAATAAAGRMSKIAETEQRYYAVTSAAKLMQDEFKDSSGKLVPVSVVEAQVTTEIMTYTSANVGTLKDSSTETKGYLFVGKDADAITISDLVSTNEIGNVTIDSIIKDAAKKVYDKSPASTRDLSLTSSNYDTLAVNITEKIDAGGNIVMTLYNAKNAKGQTSDVGEQYTVILTFGADSIISSRTETTSETSAPTNDGSYDVTTITTKMKITTTTWSLNGIRTNYQGAGNS